MERIRNKQAGFNILELLLIIVAVGVLGVGGWFVYQHNTTKVSNAAGGSQTTQQTPTTTPAPTVTYLTIKEWGVKIPLPDSIKDAYYVVGTSFSNSPDGLPSGVFLSLRSLTDPTCNPDNNNKGGKGAIGAILRFLPNETDAVTGQPLTQKYPNGTTIGSYYYGYQSWANNNPCTQTTTLQISNSGFSAATKGTLAAATSN